VAIFKLPFLCNALIKVISSLDRVVPVIESSGIALSFAAPAKEKNMPTSMNRVFMLFS
jgi:hypothetical protein